jgi:hypothetical protein
MHAMRLFLARLLLALFAASAVSAGRASSGFVVVPRQVTPPNPNGGGTGAGAGTGTGANTPADSTSPQCLEYSRVANFSTIGSNTTLRSAFIQASPVGTKSNLNMLAAAVAALPPLTLNAALNEACGNLTTLAAVEVDRNFSQGNIAGFRTSLTPDAVENGWPVIFSTIFCLTVMCVPWMFMLG